MPPGDAQAACRRLLSVRSRYLPEWRWAAHREGVAG